jgi:hypothetical protein
MKNRQLTLEELRNLATPLLKSVRARLNKLSRGDQGLLFALRRKLAKELIYDERGKPIARVKLKSEKRGEQRGGCKLCRKTLPERGAILDRLNAMKGYTAKNTRLLCPACDARVQQERRWK